MLMIVEEKVSDELMKLRLDGRIVGQWVEVLRSSCEQFFKRHARVVLDLSGVDFADCEGVQLLQHLELYQVTLINCSPFLEEQMKQTYTGSEES